MAEPRMPNFPVISQSFVNLAGELPLIQNLPVLSDIQGLLQGMEDRLGRRMRSMEGRINRRIDNRFNHTNRRLNQMGRRLTRMEQRLDQMDQRLDRVDQRLDRVDQRLDRVDQRLDRVDQRLDQVDQRFNRLEGTMDLNHRISYARSVNSAAPTDDSPLHPVPHPTGGMPENIPLTFNALRKLSGRALNDLIQQYQLADANPIPHTVEAKRLILANHIGSRYIQ